VEIDFLAKYPRAPRDPAARAAEKTPADIALARKFGKDFFDGERRHGYGGYSPSPERWRGVVADMMDHYSPVISVLDVGCAKGGMLQAFREAGANQVTGCDISAYAINKCPFSIRRNVIDARMLTSVYKYKEFSLVVSINTLHNLTPPGVIRALQEIDLVGNHAYITVDGYRTAEEKRRLFEWNLTARTILHVDDWVELFADAGYTGDFGFWCP